MALHDSGARLTIHSEFGHTCSSMSGDSMGITMQEWRTLDNSVFTSTALQEFSNEWKMRGQQITDKNISTCCAFFNLDRHKTPLSSLVGLQ